MKPFYLLLLGVGVVVGLAAPEVDWSREAAGQEEEAPSFAPLDPDNGGISETRRELKNKFSEWTKEAAEYSQINRYQISAYGNNSAFVVDSVSGRVWRVIPGTRPELIASELPQK